MVLEDGLWKTLRTDEYRKEFAPDDYVYEKAGSTLWREAWVRATYEYGGRESVFHDHLPV